MGPEGGAIVRPWEVRRLGRVPYGEALALQRDLAARRIRGDAGDILLLVEHPPVITLGRGALGEHVRAPKTERDRRGVECFEVERGGDVTFHGPGQLVAYPVLDLTPYGRDLHRYVRMLEGVLMATVGAYGIAADRRPGFPGVFVGPRKIGSIGIHVARWVAWHGLALNVTTDLSFFDLIVPCGLDVAMTSIAAETGKAPALAAVEEIFLREFCRTFQASPIERSPRFGSDPALGVPAR